MKVSEDGLYRLFSKHILNFSNLEQRAEDLVHLVAMEFLTLLNGTAHIPMPSLETVYDDTCEELWIMYRKKTYGHHTLKDWRLAYLAQK